MHLLEDVPQFIEVRTSLMRFNKNYRVKHKVQVFNLDFTR
ncbi:hypothetical protein JOD02_001458 [Caldicoprobacter guelmensis]|nr:hypothetical protein [Caldicoprobacter guelmensis]